MDFSYKGFAIISFLTRLVAPFECWPTLKRFGTQLELVQGMTRLPESCYPLSGRRPQVTTAMTSFNGEGLTLLFWPSFLLF
jgi:hypothetical protein